MHDWQRLLDALGNFLYSDLTSEGSRAITVHQNPAVEAALGTVLAARLNGSPAEDLQYLIRITKG